MRRRADTVERRAVGGTARRGEALALARDEAGSSGARLATIDHRFAARGACSVSLIATGDARAPRLPAERSARIITVAFGALTLLVASCAVTSLKAQTISVNPTVEAIDKAFRLPGQVVKAQAPGARSDSAGGKLADVPSLREVRERTDDFFSQRLRLDVGDRVFFPPGSAALGARARRALARQAAWLKGTGVDIAVVGHGDDGDERRNEALSRERAEAVAQRLVAQGVPQGRVTAVGVGRRAPVAQCGTALCQAQNRRAVTVILKRRAPSG